MKNRQAILLKCGDQFSGSARLVRAGKRRDHPPMAPQKIRAPRAAARGLQKFFVRVAEFAQTGKAGKDDLIFRFARYSWIAGDHGGNSLLVNFIGRHGLTRNKPRVIKKLPRHARERKTAVGVFWFRMACAKNTFAGGRVQPVFPHEFIRKGKTVARKFKTARGRGGFFRISAGHQI